MRQVFRAVLACGALLLSAALVLPAGAAEKLRVGKAVAFAWTFTPLDIGMQTGIFAKHGLEIEASAFNGDARMQQGLTADSIDIGIGSGPGMAFMVKGVPAKAVGAMAGVPRNMAVMVGYNSSIRTVDDLKGKKFGVTTVGSLTDWIGKRIGTLKGWGPTGITTVPIGGMPPARAAIKTGEIDGYIGALEVGYSLEEAKEWRVITSATPFVEEFITHVFFVREDVIAEAPAGGAGLPAGLAGHHRVHEIQQGQGGRDQRQDRQYQPGGHRARLRRADRHLQRGSHVRSAGGHGAQAVVHRDGAAQGNPRGQTDVHDAVFAGAGRQVECP